MTPEAIEEDFWAHHYFDNPVTESGEDEEFDTDKVLEMMESGEWEDLIDDRR